MNLISSLVIFATIVSLGAAQCNPQCIYGTCQSTTCNCDTFWTGTACDAHIYDIRPAGDITAVEPHRVALLFTRYNTTYPWELNYTLSGNASLADTDLGASSGTLAPRPTNLDIITFSVGIVDDKISELLEELIITFQENDNSQNVIINIPANNGINISLPSTVDETGVLTGLCSFGTANKTGEINVTLTVSGGSATVGSDYSLPSVSTSCSPSNESLDLAPWQVINDGNVENSETMEFTITVTSPGINYAIGNTVVRIISNDVLFINSTLPSQVLESVGTLDLATYITSNYTGTEGVLVNLTVTDDGATMGLDYTTSMPIPVVLNFTSGAIRTLPQIDIINDTINEPNTEGFILNFTSLLPITGDLSSTVTIQDNDYPNITLTLISDEMESNETRIINVTRSSTFDNLTINIRSWDGTALVSNLDYVAVNENITFLQGIDTAQLTVRVINDEIVERNETFTLNVTTPNIDSSPLTIYIMNDDALYNVSMVVQSAGSNVTTFAEEVGNVTVLLARDSDVGSLDVTLSAIPGTAQPNTDYSFNNATLTFMDGEFTISANITIINDAISEDTENFTMVAEWQTRSTREELTITDTDKQDLNITGDPQTYEENGSYNFSVTRNAVWDSLSVNITFTSNAPAPDFTNSFIQKTFAVGQATVDVTVSMVDDNLPEPNALINVTIDGGGRLVTDPMTDNLTTVVNTDLDVLTIEVNNTLEGVGVINVVVTRLAVNQQMTVNFSAIVNNSLQYPASSADFTQVTDVPLTFAVSENTVTYNITVMNDNVIEPDEEFQINVVPPPTMATGNSTIVKILNDDPESITTALLVGGYENSGTIPVRMERVLTIEEFNVTVNTVDATAVAGRDYIAVTDVVVTFPIGSKVQVLDINVTDNTVDDNDRYLFLNVTGVLTSDLLKKIYILDDDGGRPFDCRRRGQSCFDPANDVCQPSLPICYCGGNETLSGDSCNVPTDVAPCNPATKCNGNGVCANTTALPCTCNDGYYGSACENYFLKTFCSMDQMVVVANPMGTFSGEIFVFGSYGVENCTLVPLAQLPAGTITDPTLSGYGIILPHDNTTCGGVYPQEIGGMTTWRRRLFIAYTKGVQFSTDQVVTVDCYFNNTHFVTMGGNITVNGTLGSFVQEKTASKLSPVILAANQQGQALTAGSVLSLRDTVTITVNVPSPYQGIAIHAIRLENGKTGNESQVFHLLIAGCIQNNAKSVIRQPKYSVVNGVVNKQRASFDFDSFKFTKSNVLVVYVTSRVCLVASSCTMTCAQPRRKRREVSNERTLSTFFRVYTEDVASNTVIPGDNSNVLTSNVISQQPHTAAFVPMVVSLSIVTLILIIICCTIIFVLIRGRRVGDKKV